MRRLLVLLCSLCLLLSALVQAHAGILQVRGGMDSRIAFEIEKVVQSADASKRFYLSFVVPKTYTSPTFSQVVDNFRIQFTPEPSARKTWTDSRGNEIVEGRWDSPPSAISVRVSFDAQNTTSLTTIASDAPFPVRSISREAEVYLASSEQVQSDDPAIRDMAQQLTEGMTSQYAAVERISAWVVDHLRYVNPPKQYDALYGFTSGKGNCQNYSHLAAALMRAQGIPVRIVNGITLDQPFDIELSQSIIRSKMGLGRHSWIEVWFPDLGWVPFNPQTSAMYVPNRFIRVEIGLDNKETVSDGRARWVPVKGSPVRPSLREIIASDFASDNVALAGHDISLGISGTVPDRRLMLPAVQTVAAASPKQEPAPQGKDASATGQIDGKSRPLHKPADTSASKPTSHKGAAGKASEPVSGPDSGPDSDPDSGKPGADTDQKKDKPKGLHDTEPNVKSDGKTDVAPDVAPDVKQEKKPETKKPVPKPLPKMATTDKPALKPDSPVVLGNLEFPENVDFATYESDPTRQDGMMTVTRNFMVETAEYVTASLRQYAQVVELPADVDVKDVSLALHRFGGSGMMWLDVYDDTGGKPGELVAASDMIDASSISLRPGYRWVAFSFEDSTLLEKGRYWLALGYTGDPIVNWFFTYGKPVGPPDGTRFRDTFVQNWSGALDYEFNYRVRGVVR